MTTTVVYHGPGSFCSAATGDVEHGEAVEMDNDKAHFAVSHRSFVYEPGEYDVTDLKKIAGGLSDEVKETMADLEKEGEERKGALDALKTDS